ncbi:putative Reverse transcriptase [Seiridium cardinale]|uniref:Reverse transcriptase n=1 Tax=Seiridium cardinale TaxID=138064 RepID=A0ABR2X673_9PEZI
MITSSADKGNRKLVNSSIYLSQYGLQVYHLPGRLNFVPDALSRLRAVQDAASPNQPIKRSNEEPVLDNIWHVSSKAMIDPELKTQMQQGYLTDRTYKKIIWELQGTGEATTEVLNENFSRPGYLFEITDGLLYNIARDNSRRLCVPHSVIKDVLEMAHDDKHYFGEKRMLKEFDGFAFHRKIYLPIRKDPLPMKIVAMDFVVGMLKVSANAILWQLKGHDYYDSLMIVTCAISKRSMLIPGNAKYSAQDWATVFVRQLLLSDWGIPTGIISDRDRKFTSDFWKGFWKALGTRLLMTTAYYPQADGLAERKNQTVELAIRYHAFVNPESNWLDVLPSLQWNLNAAYHEAIKSTPYIQLFGFKLPGPLDAITPDHTTFQEVKDMRESLRQDAQLAMDFAVAKAKRLVAHLTPRADGEDPWHRRPPPPGPIEDDQFADVYEIDVIL